MEFINRFKCLIAFRTATEKPFACRQKSNQFQKPRQFHEKTKGGIAQHSLKHPLIKMCTRFPVGAA